MEPFRSGSKCEAFLREPVAIPEMQLGDPKNGACLEIVPLPNGCFYSGIKDSRTVTTDEVIKELARECTLTVSDARAVLAGLSGVLVRHFKEGDRVRFEELGEFYLTFSVGKDSGYLAEIPASAVRFKHLRFLADRRIFFKGRNCSSNGLRYARMYPFPSIALARGAVYRAWKDREHSGTWELGNWSEGIMPILFTYLRGRGQTPLVPVNSLCRAD